MHIDNYGKVFLNEKEIFDNIYLGNLDALSKLCTDNKTAEIFNYSKNLNKDAFDDLKTCSNTIQDIKNFDQENQKNWFMPKNYCPTLIADIYDMCKTKEQKDRVTLELELFNQHDMIDLLFYLKYLVDTMRLNNIVWGVGRGSSVASYVLHLIGIHKIDSLKFNLDIKEFLK